VTLPLPPEMAWDAMAARLAQHGFTSDVSQRPARLAGKKPTWPKPDGVAIGSPHVYKPMTFDSTLRPSGSKTEVDATVTMDDFILLDSGEWDYVQWVIDDALSNRSPDAPADPAPFRPSPSSNALIALFLATAALTGALLPLVWPWLRGEFLDGYAGGAALAAILCFPTAFSGVKEARLQPHLVSAKWLPFLVYLVAAAAVAVAAWLIIGHYIPAVAPWGAPGPVEAA
jgi:hypothetical protein